MVRTATASFSVENTIPCAVQVRVRVEVYALSDVRSQTVIVAWNRVFLECLPIHYTIFVYPQRQPCINNDRPLVWSSHWAAKTKGRLQGTNPNTRNERLTRLVGRAGTLLLADINTRIVLTLSVELLDTSLSFQY